MRNQKPQRRLWLQRIFSNDIRVGIPTSRSIGSSDDYGSSATFQSCTDSINNLKAQCASTQFDFASCESFNRSTDTIFTELEQPCSSSKQKASFFATPIAQSTFTSMSSFDLMKPTKKADESVAHAFGLNDYGDIIIHTDHICEETGFGFLARQKRQMYRKVQSGKEMVEKRKSCITHACKRILKLCAEKLCQGEWIFAVAGLKRGGFFLLHGGKRISYEKNFWRFVIKKRFVEFMCQLKQLSNPFVRCVNTI